MPHPGWSWPCNMLGAAQMPLDSGVCCHREVYAMNAERKDLLAKVPAITLGFWIIKIPATTATRGSALLLSLLAAVLIIWPKDLGCVDISSSDTPKAESYYWIAIMSSRTLDTALGDWTSDTAGVGNPGGAGVFGILLMLVVARQQFTAISRTVLFWTASVPTRPLGAVVGELLDKPAIQGGRAFGHYTATGALLAAIVNLIPVLPQRAASKSH